MVYFCRGAARTHALLSCMYCVYMARADWTDMTYMSMFHVTCMTRGVGDRPDRPPACVCLRIYGDIGLLSWGLSHGLSCHPAMANTRWGRSPRVTTTCCVCTCVCSCTLSLSLSTTCTLIHSYIHTYARQSLRGGWIENVSKIQVIFNSFSMLTLPPIAGRPPSWALVLSAFR